LSPKRNDDSRKASEATLGYGEAGFPLLCGYTIVSGHPFCCVIFVTFQDLGYLEPLTFGLAMRTLGFQIARMLDDTASGIVHVFPWSPFREENRGNILDDEIMDTHHTIPQVCEGVSHRLHTCSPSQNEDPQARPVSIRRTVCDHRGRVGTVVSLLFRLVNDTAGESPGGSRLRLSRSLLLVCVTTPS